MLLPNETAKLRQQFSRTPIYLLVIGIVAVICTLGPGLIYLSSEGRVDHLLGNDEMVTATVDNVEETGSCGRRSRSTEHRVYVSWTIDGEPRGGSYLKCGLTPSIGDSIEVWVGPTGHVEDDSPTYDRIGLGSATVVIGGMVLGIGLLIVVSQRRKMHRLLAHEHARLSPPIPVTIVRGSKSQLWMVHSMPAVLGNSLRLRVEMILFNAYGAPAKLVAPRTISGDWWLYLVHTNDPKQRIGLLGRGQERAWIQFRRR